MTPTVAVVGGGYGGVTVAKALDQVADVVLIEPRDTFVHNVATLRAVVDPEWIERLFLPYDQLLGRGAVRRDRAVRVTDTGVELASGGFVPADYIVVATGSAHAWPAKVDVEDSAAAKAKLRATHAALAAADRVLLLGAGAVGLEFAGEITTAWPGKSVTVVDPSPQLLTGRFPTEFNQQLTAQLDTLGVELLLRTSLREPPPSPPGTPGAFTVTTTSGQSLSADIWFACYGATPNSDPLTALVAAHDPGAVRADGLVTVTEHLRVPGYERVFAIGDITAVAEMKMAHLAQSHAEVVAANITALIQGNGKLTGYQGATDAIILPLGPSAGLSYAAEWGGVLDAEQTAQIKGGHLFVDTYRDLLGLTAAAS